MYYNQNHYTRNCQLFLSLILNGQVSSIKHENIMDCTVKMGL